MKSLFRNITVLSGLAALVAGIVLLILDASQILNLDNINQIPTLAIVLGIGLVIGGLFQVLAGKNKQVQIEAKDERHILIDKKAKAFGFDLLSSLLVMVNLLLAIFDYISVTVFLIYFGLYVLAQFGFVFRLWYLQKRM